MKIDLSTLITRKAIPLGLAHVDAFYHAKEYSVAFNAPIAESYYDFVGHDIHPASHSRKKEVLYVHNVTQKLLPLLVSKKTLSCG